MDRIAPGLVAIAAAVVLGVAVAVPFVAVLYRRRARPRIRDFAAWFALLAYVLALGAYTLLPLPTVGDYRCTGVQLRPLGSILPALSTGSLRDAAVQQVVLNVALFVPWGVFVRGLARRGWLVAGISGLIASALIETTQLTGVWGLYPCAYRVFDVDDLLLNTLGAVLGGLASVAFFRRPASRGDASEPAPVTAPRRLLAMVLDWLVVVLTIGALEVGWRILMSLLHRDLDTGAAVVDVAATLLVAGGQLLVVLSSGSTIGERAVLLTSIAPDRMRRRRAVRFLAGIGGVLLLDALPGPAGLLVFPFVLASLIAVVASPDRRGLALAIAGLRPADVRSLRPPTGPPDPPAPPDSPEVTPE